MLARQSRVAAFLRQELARISPAKVVRCLTTLAEPE